LQAARIVATAVPCCVNMDTPLYTLTRVDFDHYYGAHIALRV
jgi:hypothetical protein